MIIYCIQIRVSVSLRTLCDTIIAAAKWANPVLANRECPRGVVTLQLNSRVFAGPVSTVWLTRARVRVRPLHAAESECVKRWIGREASKIGYGIVENSTQQQKTKRYGCNLLLL